MTAVIRQELASSSAPSRGSNELKLSAPNSTLLEPRGNPTAKTASVLVTLSFANRLSGTSPGLKPLSGSCLRVRP